MGRIGAFLGIATGFIIVGRAATHDLSVGLWVNVAIIAGIAVVGAIVVPRSTRGFGACLAPLAVVASIVCLATGQWEAFVAMLLISLLSVVMIRFAFASLSGHEEADEQFAKRQDRA